jgi:Rps23 Pro-64 3,4-dihydroxylase Tpa1-like proline 4-hydroxylase
MFEVRKEIVSNLATVDRETDLFKVSQTMDLNNIPLDSPHAAKTPHLMALRTHMYSDAFRSFLERVTGCGKLSSRVDCAANIYSNGSHLLCHDDVITTRKLSYIIYLSKTPEEEHELARAVAAAATAGSDAGPAIPPSICSWDPAYGGGLELFPAVAAPLLPRDARPTAKLDLSNVCGCPDESDAEDADADADAAAAATAAAAPGSGTVAPVPGSSAAAPGAPTLLVDEVGQWVPVPLSVPSKVIPPIMNTMVVFEVKPGQSFHAVQEVYTHAAKRVSIQGWFHFAGNRPAGYDWGATVRLLQVPALVPLPRTVRVPAEAAGYSTALLPPPSATGTGSAAAAVPVPVPAPASVSVYDALAAGAVPLAPDAAALILRDMCVESAPAPSRATAVVALEALAVAAGADDDAAAGPAAVALTAGELADTSAAASEHGAAVAAALARWQEPGAGAEMLLAAATGSIVRRALTAPAGPADSQRQQEYEDKAADARDAAAVVAPETVPVSPSELAFLRSWVNPMYTHAQTLVVARETALATGVLHLAGFLRPDVERLLTAAVVRADVEDRLALVPVRRTAAEADIAVALAAAGADAGAGGAAEAAAVAVEAEGDEGEDDAKKGKANKGKADKGKGAKPRGGKSAAAGTKKAPKAAAPSVCTEFEPKFSPPSYTTGISPLFLTTNATAAAAAGTDADADADVDNHLAASERAVSLCGAWRLRGPSYRMRVCEFEAAPAFLAPAGLPAAAPALLPLVTASLRSVPAAQRAGLLLSAVSHTLFQSAAFARLLHWLTGARPRAQTTRVRRYRPGLDYTVGTYDALLKRDDDVVFSVAYTLVDQGQADACARLWQHGSGDAGAADCEAAGARAVPLYPGWERDKIGILTADEARARAEKAVAKPKAGTRKKGGAKCGPGAKPGAKAGAKKVKPAGSTAGGDAEDSDDTGESGAAAGSEGFAINAHAMRLRGDALTKRALWDGDDCGGFAAHVPVDRTTEGDNAEEYSSGDEDDADARGRSRKPALVSISAEANTLTIIRKLPNVLSFTRYVNNMAPGSKWTIESEVLCADEDETEDEDEDEEDGWEDGEEDDGEMADQDDE